MTSSIGILLLSCNGDYIFLAQNYNFAISLLYVLYDILQPFSELSVPWNVTHGVKSVELKMIVWKG